MSDAKVELGRRLFYDTRLSGNGAFSCGYARQAAAGYPASVWACVNCVGVVTTRLPSIG